jgi:transcriptional antiterminator RfaH
MRSIVERMAGTCLRQRGIDGVERVLRWYLIHTKPARESLAAVNLERQGYQVHLPRVVQSDRRRGQWRERVVPLFPRYLFLRLCEGRQALGPVRYSLGVAGIVRFGASYAIVPDRIIDELRERADPETGLHRLVTPPVLVRGATVHFTNGPFEGLDGVFEREAGSARVVVLLNLLGQDTSVRVPAAFVLPGCAA